MQSSSEIRKDAMLVTLVAKIRNKFVHAKAVQEYGGGEWICSCTHISSLGSRCRYAVSFTRLPFYPLGKKCLFLLNRGLRRYETQFGLFERRKITVRFTCKEEVSSLGSNFFRGDGLNN